jgi:UDP-N-acetyl-D-mannosaminuronate dehydrogenase
MKVYQQLLNGDKALAVVGLGYVGMPLAIEFAKKIKVIGYDKSEYKINCYKRGIDATEIPYSTRSGSSVIVHWYGFVSTFNKIMSLCRAVGSY